MLKFTLNQGATMASNASNSDSDSNFVPSGGHVSRLRQNWSVHEDGALAQRLQSEEIQQHLSGNRQRNHQIREDVPRARHEQVIEVENACKKAEERRRVLHDIEVRDAEVAKQVQTRLFGGPGTPPLPVMEDGDVPEAAGVEVPRRIVYNDDQYQVKLARPALVKDEPVYANNKPEHYAVSTKYPGGAISKIPAASPRRSYLTQERHQEEENVVGLAGLSQRDLVLSQRAEAQLEQQKRDEELAKRLQQQFCLEGEGNEDGRVAQEAQDLEYARMIHAKEKAKLKRAKERKRQKKLQQQQQNNETEPRSESRRSGGGTNHTPQRSFEDHQGGASKPENDNEEEDDESVISAPPLHLKLPARRPYMNTGAIDSHQSACNNLIPPQVEQDHDADESELSEPQYANVGPSVNAPMPTIHVRQTSDDGLPIPPYMPMQQPMSKRSTSMEKRIKKRKEKEGCKQQ